RMTGLGALAADADAHRQRERPHPVQRRPAAIARRGAVGPGAGRGTSVISTAQVGVNPVRSKTTTATAALRMRIRLSTGWLRSIDTFRLSFSPGPVTRTVNGPATPQACNQASAPVGFTSSSPAPLDRYSSVRGYPGREGGNQADFRSFFGY